MNSAELYEHIVNNGSPKMYSIKKTVPAGRSNVNFTKDMDGAVLFASTELRGTFTTLSKDGADIVDYGISPCTMSISDKGSSDYQVMDAPVNVESIMVPGHVRSALATNNSTSAPVPNPIFEPLKMPYVWSKKIDILVNNPSEVDQELEFTWVGYEIESIQ